MYQPTSFTVNPQYAESDQNLAATGYNTQPAFVLAGSKASERHSRRKKSSVPVLGTISNRHWDSSGSTRLFYPAPHGLMTPETPSYSFVDNANYSNPADKKNVLPGHRSYSNNYFSSHFIEQTNYGFSPITPPIQTQIQSCNRSPQHRTDRFSPDINSQTSPHIRHSDQSDRNIFQEDFSPLMSETHQLLPAFDSDMLVDNLQNSSPTIPIPRLRNKKISKSEAIESVQSILQGVELTPTLLLLNLLDPAASNISARDAFFRCTNEDNICQLLDIMLNDDKGSRILKKWMAPHAVNLVCDLVNDEMEAAKPHLFMKTHQTTPEFVEEWDINGIMDTIAKDITPVWSSILYAASEPKRSSDEESRSRPTTRNIISSQVHYLRSQHSCKVQIGLGLMASSTGASRNLMGVLQRCGLTTSYPSVANTVSSLSGFSVKQAANISKGPHAFAYDNVNMKSSIFVEQRPDAMSKVQSGTFAVIYELPDAQLKDMRLAPILENLKKSRLLKMQDLRGSLDATASYISQTAINIAKILIKNVPEFASELASDPLLQNQPRRKQSAGEKTKFYPVCTSTIEEASITGNLQVHDDVYIYQLKRDPDSEELNEYAIPCINDQLTNSRVRSCQVLRAKDNNPWERREVFQLAFGMFHLLMNLIWALLNIHRGTISESGSLAYYFNILEKVRLASEKPDFHALLTALTQILEGLILNAWLSKCNQPSLAAFAKTNPKAEDIISIARLIIKKYATPKTNIPKSELPSKRASKMKTLNTNSDSEDDVEPLPPVDSVFANTILLTRDLLYVVELTDAISSGDFGRIEDILPDLACIFRGAGSNNYSTEILHFLFNVKEVWTPEFANIMRDIMLVNPSGLEGHWMGTDMNIEHLIGYLKALFAAKGIYANWDRLAHISASVNYLQLIKKRVTRSLGTSYQGSTHKYADTTVLKMRIAERARELDFQKELQGRDVQSKMKPDLKRVGYRKMETSALSSFNKKAEELKMGKGFEADEVDDIPAAEFEQLVFNTDGSFSSSLQDSN